jgi:hypothetical protein
MKMEAAYFDGTSVYIYQFTRRNNQEHPSVIHVLGFVRGSRNENNVTLCNNMRLHNIFKQYSSLRISTVIFKCGYFSAVFIMLSLTNIT